MKNIFASAICALALIPALSSSAAIKDHHETKIIEVKIDYARALTAADSNGFRVEMAAVGGQVVFEGHAPVFATLKVAGQIYTAPCDKEGNFSYFVYTNGAGRFTVEGWSPHEAAGERVLPIAEGTIK